MANGYSSDDVRSRLNDAFYDLLLDRVSRDRFPSTSMLDMIEARLTEEQLPDYVDVLLDKVSRDRFPSMDMLKRLSALI
ncbi:MAG TPA: hypothetical protein VKB75_11720 [Jatrophihabitans sp.]|nr:hypothetical protein [Jatrophihabitans sp.]